MYKPAFNPKFFAEPLLNAKLEARSRELEPEVPDYSSSFFDDYDEPAEDDVDLDSDDEFNEMTLWEIASLLKSEDVPSTNSLLPPPRTITENYDEETDFESDAEAETPIAKQKPIQLPIQPLSLAKNESKLWASGSESTSVPIVADLPQPDTNMWQAYLPEDFERSRPQVSGSSFSVLSSRNLWSSTDLQSPAGEATAIWENATAMKEMNHMWTPPTPEIVSVSTTNGPFTHDSGRPVIHRKAAAPTAKDMTKAPQSLIVQEPVVSPRSLWAPESTPKVIAWIYRSTKSPEVSMTWNSNPASTAANVTGLFVKSAQRSGYRITNASPAANTMGHKARMSEAPLSRLTSTKLWTGGEDLPAERHWVSESSIRSESPSAYSESSSGSSSLTSDTSSVKSNSTKASSH